MKQGLLLIDIQNDSSGGAMELAGMQEAAAKAARDCCGGLRGASPANLVQHLARDFFLPGSIGARSRVRALSPGTR